MRFGLRWWHLVCAAGFTGIFVVPVLGVTVRALSVSSSLASTAGAAPSSGSSVGSLLIEALFALALLIAVPGLAVALYRDASEIADGAWTPNPRLYGALAVVYPLSLLVAGVHLYRRYRQVGIGGFPIDEPLSGERLAASRWWYSVAVGPLLFLLGFGLFLLPYGAVASFPAALYLRIVGLVLPAGAGILLFNAGLAADLTQVRGSTVEWNPGARRYQLPSLLVPGLIPLVAVVYLGNRHRHVGVP
jgi:hypothetical protein